MTSTKSRINNPQWIDISLSLHSSLASWPDDPPFTLTQIAHQKKGHDYTLHAFSCSTHSGTHVDAPAHFISGGATIDHMPHDAGCGKATLWEFSAGQIEERHLFSQDRLSTDRLLLKTKNSAQKSSAQFDKNFVGIDRSAANWLAKQNLKLIGIDGPSISSFNENHQEIHTILFNSGIWIIEGLCLKAVQPGLFDLQCLPLKIAGAEAAPARAFIRPIE